MARYRAALALILILTLLPVATPVAAQDPDPAVQVCLTQSDCSGSNLVAINEWYVVGEVCGINSDINLSFWYWPSANGLEFWVDVEMAWSHSGASTASFFRGPAGIRTHADPNEHSTTASHELLQDGAVLVVDAIHWFDSIEDSRTTMPSGLGNFCTHVTGSPCTLESHVAQGAPMQVTSHISGAQTYRPSRLGLTGKSAGYYSACQTIYMRYTDVRFEFAPPEPPTAYCPPGSASVLGADTVFDLAAGATWSDAVQVVVPEFKAFFFFEPDSSPAAPSYDLELTLNDVTVATTVTVSDTIWYGDAFRVTVPITGGVPGPDAVLAAQNTSATGADLVLADVCLVAYQGSALCPDGIEMLSAPVVLSDLSGEWQLAVKIPFTRYVTQITLGNPNGLFPIAPIGITGHVAEIMFWENETWFSFARVTIPPGEMETVTLPKSPGTSFNPRPEEPVSLKIENLAWSMRLESVCVVDGEEHYQETFLTAEDCLLNNPDFAYPFTTEDWSPSGDVEQTTSGAAGCGAAFGSAGGRIEQQTLGKIRQVYNMEVRARGEFGAMDFGTDRTTVMDAGPQIETVPTGGTFGVYENLVYLTPEDSVFVAGWDVEVDYVCLLDSFQTPFDAWLDNVMNLEECQHPGENPHPGDVAGTIIWVGRIIIAAICQWVVYILKLLNSIYTMIRDTLLSVPALPGHGGEFTWPIWIREAITGIGTTIGIYLMRIWEFVQPLVGLIVAWIQRTVANVLAWFAAQFGLDVAALLATTRLIGIEFEFFFRAMGAEMQREAAAALVLLLQTVDLLLVLSNGVRSGVTGNSTAFTSAEIEAAAPFIWAGFQFVNTVAAQTPVAALNIVALAIVAFGLLMWTGRKFQSIVALITPGNAGSTA